MTSLTSSDYFFLSILGCYFVFLSVAWICFRLADKKNATSDSSNSSEDNRRRKVFKGSQKKNRARNPAEIEIKLDEHDEVEVQVQNFYGGNGKKIPVERRRVSDLNEFEAEAVDAVLEDQSRFIKDENITATSNDLWDQAVEEQINNMTSNVQRRTAKCECEKDAVQLYQPKVELPSLMKGNALSGTAGVNRLKSSEMANKKTKQVRTKIVNKSKVNLTVTVSVDTVANIRIKVLHGRQGGKFKKVDPTSDTESQTKKVEAINKSVFSQSDVTGCRGQVNSTYNPDNEPVQLASQSIGNSIRPVAATQVTDRMPPTSDKTGTTRDEGLSEAIGESSNCCKHSSDQFVDAAEDSNSYATGSQEKRNLLMTLKAQLKHDDECRDELWKRLNECQKNFDQLSVVAERRGIISKADEPIVAPGNWGQLKHEDECRDELWKRLNECQKNVDQLSIEAERYGIISNTGEPTVAAGRWGQNDQNIKAQFCFTPHQDNNESPFFSFGRPLDGPFDANKRVDENGLKRHVEFGEFSPFTATAHLNWTANKQQTNVRPFSFSGYTKTDSPSAPAVIKDNDLVPTDAERKNKAGQKFSFTFDPPSATGNKSAGSEEQNLSPNQPYLERNNIRAPLKFAIPGSQNIGFLGKSVDQNPAKGSDNVFCMNLSKGTSLSPDRNRENRRGKILRLGARTRNRRENASWNQSNSMPSPFTFNQFHPVNNFKEFFDKPKEGKNSATRESTQAVVNPMTDIKQPGTAFEFQGHSPFVNFFQQGSNPNLVSTADSISFNPPPVLRRRFVAPKDQTKSGFSTEANLEGKAANPPITFEQVSDFLKALTRQPQAKANGNPGNNEIDDNYNVY